MMEYNNYLFKRSLVPIKHCIAARNDFPTKASLIQILNEMMIKYDCVR